MKLSKGKLFLIIVVFLFIYYNFLKSKSSKQPSKKSAKNNPVKDNCYMSHTKEPHIGDTVKNVNPRCLHYKSKGKVLAISELPNNMGKIITYQVTNFGNTFKRGDQLSKTLDQLNSCLNDHE